MELALPHVVVRICRPGMGSELVAALSLHPVEVSEARDASELRRISAGRPAILVVLVEPPDERAAVAESEAEFPAVPVLIITDPTRHPVPPDGAGSCHVTAVSGDQSLQDVCWFVLEAISRAARLPGILEHPLGPDLVDIDDRGIVSAALISGFVGLRQGVLLQSFVAPSDRTAVTNAIERARAGDSQFLTVRLLDGHGRPLSVALGLRCGGDDHVSVLAQPVISGGPVVGRRVNDRDPITGLLTRWAMSRALEAREASGTTGAKAAVIMLTLDDFTAISDYIGHRHTDVTLVRVADALHRVFPYPAIICRLMGDSFVAYVAGVEADEILHRAERLRRMVGRIVVPGTMPPFQLRASVGVASLSDGDHDLALRLAEAAAAESHAAGGDRSIVAGSGLFRSRQAYDLKACMDSGSWEVWLQPVVQPGDGRAAYHEALARFDVPGRPSASRADFFTAGRAAGLLERFDRMMLQRVLEVLEAHPDATLAVNVCYETFISSPFPDSFLDLIRQTPGNSDRIIIEISSRCVAAAEQLVRPRLERLAAAGVRVAIDDFGSGICRLRFLTQLPLAIVKLDRLVTGYIDDDPLQRDFVRTVVSLCRARGITTVAEYTRSDAQFTRLVEDGVDLFQGELFGMPRPVADVLGMPATAVSHG